MRGRPGKPHQDVGQRQTQHGPDNHRFAAIPIAQDSPDGLQESGDHKGSGKKQAAPDFNVFSGGNAEFLQIERKERHHHAQPGNRDELGNPEAVKIFFPRFHQSEIKYESLIADPDPIEIVQKRNTFVFDNRRNSKKVILLIMYRRVSSSVHFFHSDREGHPLQPETEIGGQTT